MKINSMVLAFLAGASVMVLGAGAQAADLPRRSVAPSIVPVPLFTWSGFYVGANAGYAFGENDIRTTGVLPGNVANVAAGFRPGSVSLDNNGFIGGGQIGYNIQFNQIVLGAEADIQYVDNGDTFSAIAPGGAAFPAGFRNDFRQELNYLGTVRARIGFAADRFLVYATGGLAYGEVKTNANFFTPGGALQFTGSKSDVEVGYAVGGGVEYAFTNNISAKVEYLYYDLGDRNLNVGATPIGVGAYTSKFDTKGSIVRAGVNFRFSSF